MAPAATRNQLVPEVERALGDTKRSSRVLLLQADPDAVPELGTVGGTAVSVHGARSPLAVRRLLHAQGDEFLVVLTDCDPVALGDDVLARAYANRVHQIDRWAAVRSLFRVRSLAADLVRRPHLADALIEFCPLTGYAQPTAQVLDLDTATAALVRVALDIDDSVDDLAGFLRWLDRPEAVARIAAARPTYLHDLLPALEDRFSSGVRVALAAVDADRAEDLVPLALSAGVVHGGDAPDPGAEARLDEWLQRPGLPSDAYRRAAAAAEVIITSPVTDPVRAAAWTEQAERLLTDLGALGLAERSDLLPAGFDQRLAAAGRALRQWKDQDDPAAAAVATAAVSRVRSHRGATASPHRMERLEMAARLIRRRSREMVLGDSLATAVAGYEADGAWFDSAWLAVSRGDTDAQLGALYAELAGEIAVQRETDGLRFARLANEAADALPDELIGVEDVLTRVVAPLADVRPVLLLVLDGLSWPAFTDLVTELDPRGWAPYRRGAEAGIAPCTAVAALPTVTEVSRTSLLAGRLRTGNQGSEQRAFTGHQALGDASPDAAPVLFHKRHLRAGGLDTLPEGALDAVADDHRRVVAVVLNNIDERLKDVAAPPDRWTLRDLDPTAPLLDEARRAGRTVVITADHGHILDRDAEARQGDGGGERWRRAELPPSDGEVMVEGTRVVTEDHRAVLPWREQVRYGPRHNGYHGGLTARELLVPLVVLSADDLPSELGWVATSFRRPAWWHDTAVLRPAPAAPRPAEPVGQPSLFEEPAPAAAPQPEASPPTVSAEPAWIGTLLTSDRFVQQRSNPRVRIGDDELRRMLGVLDATGTMAIAEERLALEADLPAARVGRYLAQLQDLVNVDGYGVVTITDGEVRFDHALLVRQFDL